MIPRVWMLSGQGGQYLGMGSQRYATDQVFRHRIGRCETIVGDLTGCSVKELMQARHDSKDLMMDLRTTNAALFSIQYALAYSLLETGENPDCFLGYSLGEYVSLTLSGSLSLEDGMSLVVQLAEAVTSTCEEGRMLAVLAGAEFYFQHPECFHGVHLACVNSSDNCVVAGSSVSISVCRDALGRSNVLSQELPVRYPFHCPLIEPARERFMKCLGELDFQPANRSVISACTARTLDSPEPPHLWRVIRCRVDFRATIEGIERKQPHEYWDIGPTGALANAVTQQLGVDQSARVHTIMSPFDVTTNRLENHTASVSTDAENESVGQLLHAAGKR